MPQIGSQRALADEARAAVRDLQRLLRQKEDHNNQLRMYLAEAYEIVERTYNRLEHMPTAAKDVMARIKECVPNVNLRKIEMMDEFVAHAYVDIYFGEPVAEEP